MLHTEPVSVKWGKVFFHSGRKLTFSFLLALNFLKQSTVSCLCTTLATRSRCCGKGTLLSHLMRLSSFFISREKLLLLTNIICHRHYKYTVIHQLNGLRFTVLIGLTDQIKVNFEGDCIWIAKNEQNFINLPFVHLILCCIHINTTTMSYLSTKETRS